MTLASITTRALLLALVVSLGCRLKGTAWVVSGSQKDNLVIGLAQERGTQIPVENLDEFTITTCSSATTSRRDVWAITTVSTRATIPTQIRYGVVPPGFKGPSAPPTLTPG